MRTLRLQVARVVALIFLLAGISAQAQKWKEGDVFLGVGNGQWKVFRPSTASFVDAIVDTSGSTITSPGATNGSALDNTWHLVGTDSGANSKSSFVVRFNLSPNDPNNPTSVPDVLSVFNGSAGTGSVSPQAVIVDRSGNIFLANASPETIVKFGPSGNFLAAFPLANKFVDKKLAGIDLSSDGSVLFYTSGGSTLRKLQLTGPSAGSITTLNSFPGQTLFDLRVVPAGGFPAACALCPAGGGFLVAAGSSVLLLDNSGNLLGQYPLSGQTNLQALALDPSLQDINGARLPPQNFWVASRTSSSFFQVNLSTAAVQSFSAGSVAGIASLSTYGGFIANQPTPTAFPVVTMAGSPVTNSPVFLFDNTDKLTLTGYDFPSGFFTNASVFAAAVPPSAGVSDSGLPCTQTIPGLPSNLCTVWQIDVDPALPSGSLMAMKIFAEQALPGGVDSNTRILRNERDDVSSMVRNIDPSGHSTFSVYSLNEVGGNNEQCTYFPPVVEGATLNNPGNITFRFQCAGLPGAQLATLRPRISIVQLVGSAAPQPFFPGITDLTGGTCCAIADYRYDPTSNTWVINVSFSNVTTTTTFVATTFDDNHIASSFDVEFTVQK